MSSARATYRARGALAAALHLRPDHPEALNTMGALATSAADAGEAVAWFEDALHAAPDDLGARYNLAQALFVVGEYRRGFDRVSSSPRTAVRRRHARPHT